MVKNMIGQTDFDDIAERINDSIDFDDVSNRDDYKTLMENHLRKNIHGKQLIPYLNELFDTTDTQRRFDDLEVIQKAQKFERKRPKKRRIRDEMITAKDTRRPTRKTLKRWKRHPAKFDIRGIDTKQLAKHPRRFVITGKDLQLKKKGIRVGVDVRGIKHYRDSKGRFTKKPK